MLISYAKLYYVLSYNHYTVIFLKQLNLHLSKQYTFILGKSFMHSPDSSVYSFGPFFCLFICFFFSLLPHVILLPHLISCLHKPNMSFFLVFARCPVFSLLLFKCFCVFCHSACPKHASWVPITTWTHYMLFNTWTLVVLLKQSMGQFCHDVFILLDSSQSFFYPLK